MDHETLKGERPEVLVWFYELYRNLRITKQQQEESNIGKKRGRRQRLSLKYFITDLSCISQGFNLIEMLSDWQVKVDPLSRTKVLRI